MTAKLVVITGTPGVGKSTIGRLLAERVGAQYVDLGRLVRDRGLYIGVDEEDGSLIVDLKLLAEEVSRLADSTDGWVVLEGHYAHQVAPKNAVHLVFVLRKNPHQLREELRSRGYRTEKILENLEAEILDVCLWEAVELHGREKVYEVDVSDRTPDDVVEELLNAVKAGAGGRVGLVDWLGMLEREGRLQEYFRD
ncbi:MAG TPA: hypothetical protein ENF62_00390 [Candidatus Bathyarchaeota archaeon]|nr:hypothetical protein [Candidatus Bathyarchaeota archaeon]